MKLDPGMLLRFRIALELLCVQLDTQDLLTKSA